MLTDRPPSRPRAWIVGTASVVLHLVLAGALGSFEPPPAAAIPQARARHDLVVEAAGRAARVARAEAAREELVASARAARDRGALELGAFLLATNAIDAEEEQVPFDFIAAKQAFAARVERLREALRKEPPLAAVGAVFSDLAYTGMPGGRVGETLLSGSGSCEPTSQLVAAALHDAALGDRVGFRYYGGAIAGVTHLTAVLDVDGVEIDLLSGAPSRPGGTRFVASEIIETYARARGLAPKRAIASGGGGGAQAGEDRPLFEVAVTRSLAGGYPPNADRFDSPLPLYGAHAVAPAPIQEPDAKVTDDAPTLQEDPTSCVMEVSLALLDPPRAIVMTPDGEGLAIDLARQPTPKDLERMATTILNMESSRASLAGESPAAVVVDACLVALYEEASVELSLAQKPDVAGRAVAEAKRARERGSAALAKLLGSGAGTPAVRRELLLSFNGRGWVLLFLDGAEQVLYEIARDAENTYSEVLLVAGLIVSPKTRARGLALAGGMTLRRRMDVMHEVFRAHEQVDLRGRARPWASNYMIDPPEGADASAAAFARTYRVFRPLAWRLWESPAPPADGVSALAAGLREQASDDATSRALTSYYVRNFVALHRSRPRGGEQIAALDRALLDAGLPSVAEAEDLALNPSELEALGLVRH